MKLPISFIESTRALMGDEEYQELSVALEQEPPASVRLNSKFSRFSRLFIHLRTYPLGGRRLLSEPTTDVYVRSPFSCRMLLRAGSLVDVCGTGAPPLRYNPCQDARSLCRSRWKVDPCPQCIARRQSAGSQ